MKTLLSRFRGNQRGTAMTEFVMFLPIFVITFAGIVNLGKFGYSSTQTKIVAQKALWDGVIPVTDGIANSGGTHMSSNAAGVHSVAHLAGLATNGSNPQQLADTYEGVVMGRMGLEGHWGESNERTRLVSFIPGVGNDLKRESSAEDVIGTQPFPQSLLNDGHNRPRGSGGLIGKLAEFISGTGVVTALGAGIRYGTVFGEHEHTFSVGVLGNYTARAHYDVLVAPSPLRGVATKTSWALARAYAEAQDEYSVMMNFGDSEWEGNSSGSGTSNPFGDLGDFDEDFDPESDEYQSQIDEEIRKKEEAEAAAAGGG